MVGETTHRSGDAFPALERWRRQHGLTYRGLGLRYGVSMGVAYRHCLPPNHRNARLPSRAQMARIVELTGGAVRPDDFYALPPVDAAA